MNRALERRLAVSHDYDPPPWSKMLPDPAPPTRAELGGYLRETAPSLHEEVESLATQHPVVRQDRLLLNTIMQLFHTIAGWLPAEVVVDLSPVPEGQTDPAVERRAVRLLTHSQRLQPRVRPRTFFAWPQAEVYELSDSLLPGSRPGASAELRRAIEAAYQLFVRVAITVAELFETCVVDPAALRGLRRQRA